MRRKQNKKIEDYVTIIEENLRTMNSKEAFNVLNRLTIIHPKRRDGGIMNCQLKEDNQGIEVDQQ